MGEPPGERYSFSGKHYALTDSPALPKPVQTPVPVIVGGHGRKRTPELAARFASEFNVVFSPAGVVAAQFERVDDACRAIGRDPKELVRSAAQTIITRIYLQMIDLTDLDHLELIASEVAPQLWTQAAISAVGPRRRRRRPGG